jgi:hypothetical protein
MPTQPDRVNGSTTAPAAAVNATATQHSLSGVMLHEARRQLGGRARSTGPPFVASDGPHDLYADGITWRFLHDRRVAVPMARPPAVAAPGFHGPRKDPARAAGDAGVSVACVARHRWRPTSARGRPGNG